MIENIRKHLGITRHGWSEESKKSGWHHHADDKGKGSSTNLTSDNIHLSSLNIIRKIWRWCLNTGKEGSYGNSILNYQKFDNSIWNYTHTHTHLCALFPTLFVPYTRRGDEKQSNKLFNLNHINFNQCIQKKNPNKLCMKAINYARFKLE